MSKHTPGPWRAWRHFDIWDIDAPYQVYQDADGNALEIHDAPERFSVIEDCTKQDAELIAAAPEMLALLKEHQWAGLETGPFGVDSWDICPECGERKSDGHSEYCEWAALLRRNHERAMEG